MITPNDTRLIVPDDLSYHAEKIDELLASAWHPSEVRVYQGDLERIQAIRLKVLYAQAGWDTAHVVSSVKHGTHGVRFMRPRH